MKKGFAIGADGGGSCMQAVIDAGLPISVVYTNKPGCEAVEVRAKKANIPTIQLNPADFGKGKQGRRAHERELEAQLKDFEFSAVVMLGDDRVKTEYFVDDYTKQGIHVFNTHPAPLPQFRGLEGYAWALGAHKDSVRTNHWTAVTFHRIDGRVDRGNIIAQAPVQMIGGDSVDDLMERGKNVEYDQIVQCLKYHLDGRIIWNPGKNQTADIENGTCSTLREEIPPLEDLMGLPDDKIFLTIDTHLGKIAAGCASGSHQWSYSIDKIPENLVFTYAYDVVKALRQKGTEVNFTFDGMDIHPIIMKKDEQKGIKPY